MGPWVERGWGRALLDVLFPPVCLLCGDLSRGRHPHCCEDCRGRFRLLDGPVCRICGRPFLPGDTPHLCLACLTAPPPFSWCRSVYLYEGEMARALSLLKYGRKLSLSAPLGEALAAGADCLALPPCDAVVPVPLSPMRTLARTFNQAEVLASAWARRSGVPLDTGVLRRRGGRPQVGLSRGERERNAAASFRPGRGIMRLAGKRVLLVDDVYTTGSTAAACARLLARADAESMVLTLARAGPPEDRGHLLVEEAVGGQEP